MLGSDNAAKKGYYIPLKSFLTNLLQSHGFRKYFYNSYREDSEGEKGILLDFFNGLKYSNQPVIQKNPNNVLIITLYHNDIKIANSLVMKHSQKGKKYVLHCIFEYPNPSLLTIGTYPSFGSSASQFCKNSQS